MSLATIEKKYIEDDPLLSLNLIPLDDTLDIKGKPTESNSPTEGIVTFDIIFDAMIAKTVEAIKIIVNIEAQKSTKNIDYPLLRSAVDFRTERERISRRRLLRLEESLLDLGMHERAKLSRRLYSRIQLD